MSGAGICAICFLVMTILILLGCPLAISMLLCSIAGFWFISGDVMAMKQMTSGITALGANYNFAVIPFFMIMGQLAGATGIAEGAFQSCKKWLSFIRGGLLDTVIISNMVFGACSGMSSAANVVFSRIALPEMEKEGYDRGLSIGTIAGAGSLSVLIPPSMPVLTFCLITNVSIGAALMLGLVTGILFAIIYILFVKVYIRIRPNTVPPKSNEKVPMREKVQSLKLLIPIILLFALIVGGSFVGWFPATVGGAVAAVVVMIYALIKKTPPKKIFRVVWEGVRSFGNMYMIIIAGQMFGRLVALSGLASAIAKFIAGTGLPAFAIFCLIVLFYLFCGMFMDCLSIIIITVPIVFPVMTSMGYHELILVMLLIFAMEIANLTPPVGVGVFYVADATKESPAFVFKSVTKFFLLDLGIILFIAAVPQSVMWFVHLMGY